MDCEIAKKTKNIIKHQQQAFEESDRTVEAPSPVAQGKIRYLAGACIHKIADRLQKFAPDLLESHLRTAGWVAVSSIENNVYFN